MSEFIPHGVDPIAYRLAQERMYGITERREAIREILDAAYKKQEKALDEARELLAEYPTLSLQGRKS